MADGFRLSGDTELQAAFRDVLRKAPDRVEDQLMKMAHKLRKSTRERTPEKRGRLRRSYRIEEPTRLPDGYKVDLRSKAPHFHLIERGHRKVTPSGRELGFVPGVFMLEQSITTANAETPEELEKWLNKLYKELHK